jgi:WD40 repeat protein
VLTGTSAGTITLWDGKTGKQKRLYPAEVVRGKQVGGLAFWPTDPRYAISGSGDGKVRLWDLERDEPLGIFTGDHKPDYMVNCVAFSPDGTRAASASFDGNVTVWHVRREGEAPTLQQGRRFLAHDRRVWRVAFSPNGKRAASGSDDGTVRVWDPETAVELCQFKGQSGGQTGGVNGVGFWDEERVVSTGDLSPDEDRGGPTSALKVWDMRSGGGAGEGEASVGGTVTGIVVDDNGVATVSTNGGPVTLYAGEDGRLHKSPAADGPASPPVRPMAYGKGKKVPQWGDGGRSAPAPAGASAAPAGATTPARDVAFLPGGKGKLVGRGDGKLELWGYANSGGTPGSRGQVVLRTLEGHKAAIQAAAVSPGGRFIVSADALGMVRVWDLMRPARCRELEEQMAAALDLLERNPTSPDAMETLRKWYAFQGREVSTKDLLGRAPALRQLVSGPGDAK